MSKLLLALALHGACAFVRPAAPAGPMTAARATTKDALAAGYQPTEGVNAAVDTNNKGAAPAPSRGRRGDAAAATRAWRDVASRRGRGGAGRARTRGETTSRTIARPRARAQATRG